MSEKVVLVLLAVEAGAVKEGSRFLPSRRVLCRAIKPCAVKPCAIKRVCHPRRVRDLAQVSSKWTLGRVLKSAAGS